MQNIKLPKIIGHRGASGLAPENTLASIKKAFIAGLSYVEVDVKISKDNIPVLLHDDSLERTTNGSGFCHNYNYHELLKLDAGSWFSKNYKNERILSLSKCFDDLYKKRMNVNIELKPNKGKEIENIHCIKNLIKVKKNIPEYFFSSFDIKSLEYAKKELHSIPRSLLIEKNSTYTKNDIIEICDKFKCFCVGLEFEILDIEIVNFLKKRNLKVTVFTINNINLVNNIFSLGVDSIFTDRPDLINS